MKVKSIYIDGLHNATAKTYQFSDMTYLFGRNGAGKSTILQGIQFALLGYIPGTPKNSREAFLRHSPKGEVTVTLTLVSDDGSEVQVHRKVTQKGTTVSITPETCNISDVIGDLELPIFNFNEFVGQTANKLKEYFIKHILPTSDGSLDWRQILTESILDCNFQDRASVIDYGLGLLNGVDGDILDQVVTANTRFKEEQSFNKSELQRLQNTIDSLIYYDDYTGPTDETKLNSDILALSALRDQLLKYNSAMFALQSQKVEILNLETHLADIGGTDGYNTAVSLLADIKAEQESINSDIANKRDELAECTASKTTVQNIINSNGCCPFTNTACETILNRLDDFKNTLEETKSREVTLSEEIHHLADELNDRRAHISRLEATIADYQNTSAKLLTLTKTMETLPEKPNTDKDITVIDRELEQLNQSLTKLRVNKQYNDTLETMTNNKYELELKGQALANWVKKTDTNGLQTTLMLAPFDELASVMTTYIKQMYGNDLLKAHFNVSTKANSFSFGLIRNNTYIPYDLLSSGEKCLYTLALMICIVHNSESPIKLLLCDDMFDHLDSVAVENIFDALKQVTDVQFIFAGVKECKNASDVIVTIE